VRSVVLALSYLPESIQGYFGDGTELGIKLSYSVENYPLGTAGAVKNAEQYLNSTFAVLNGDVFTDLDMNDMLIFHQRKEAKVTIALTQVENPCAFGTVETDSAGRVRRFVEKPIPEQVTTNWINAGIYILEPEVLGYVPSGSHYMFENGLFPRLLELSEPVYGYRFSGYWLDMGTPKKYLSLNCDLALSKAKSALVNYPNNEIFCEQNAFIHPSAQITAPVVIEGRCHIGQGVHIKGPVIIGENCHIDEGASLEKVVLWRNVNVGAGAYLKHCIISSNTKIEDNKKLVNCVVTPSASGSL
jgi:mannose-1-phosphate guanylyltransferase